MTIDGQANSGVDYEKIDQIIDFKFGENEKNIEIQIYDDEGCEDNEDFFV